jgi:hypothetical protein
MLQTKHESATVQSSAEAERHFCEIPGYRALLKRRAHDAAKSGEECRHSNLRHFQDIAAIQVIRWLTRGTVRKLSGS